MSIKKKDVIIISFRNNTRKVYDQIGSARDTFDNIRCLLTYSPVPQFFHIALSNGRSVLINADHVIDVTYGSAILSPNPLESENHYDDPLN